MRRTGVVGVVVGVVLLSGCSSGGSGGAGGDASAGPSVSASASVAPRDALAAYEAATASGCTDAADCQEFMTRKLAAAVQVREAMKAADPGLYAEPIGMVNEAERQADHYGRDSLGAKGNMLAVATPLQEMVAWFRVHSEG